MERRKNLQSNYIEIFFRALVKIENIARQSDEVSFIFVWSDRDAS